MSRLKISENLFLEVNELNRLVKFIVEDGYKRLIKPLVSHWGIVRNEYNTYFKVTRAADNNININPGLAFNRDAEGIVNDERYLIVLPNSPLGTKKWIILSRDVTNWERGYVHIVDDGSIEGSNTEFLKVLRGQPNFPTKVSFGGSLNGEALNPVLAANNVYEVVKVTNDENALLFGDFAQQDDLRYKVYGTFTPGFIPLDQNAYIYEYDWHHIEIVESETRPEVIDGMEFILACVTYTNDGINISDEREDFMFNEIGSNADSENNASGPADVSVASICSANIVSGVNCLDTLSCDIELCIEHVFHIDSFSVNSNQNETIFHINQGHNNLLGSNPTLADNLFKGWTILNRSNMKSLKILDNTANDLHISTYYESFDAGVNDIVIIPPFDEVEYEVKLSGNTYNNNFPFVFRCPVESIGDRLRFYCIFPGQQIPGNVIVPTVNPLTIEVRYRYVEKGYRYPFNTFAQHTFQFQGLTRNYANGRFTINIQNFKPEAEQRNYS